MAKKRVIHCGKCESPVTIYKKGKKHRVFVCPSCGIIATNPAPIGLIARAARALPGPAKRALSVVDEIAPGLVPSGGEDATATTCGTKATRRNLAPFYITKALAGGS